MYQYTIRQVYVSIKSASFFFICLMAHSTNVALLYMMSDLIFTTGMTYSVGDMSNLIFTETLTQ